MRHRTFPILAIRFAGLALLSSTVMGCSGSGGLVPAYEGCATDENWRTFDDYIETDRIQSDAANLPKWLQPTTNSAPASAPPTFSWQPSATNSGSANGNASCEKFTPTSLKPGLSPRHEPPVSGIVYDLHFAAAGTTVYRVLTTRQSATLPASTWQGLSGKQVEVTLYSAQLLRNDVAQGPFRAPPLQITVAP